MNRKEFELLELITLNPDPKVGKPVINDTTITVEFILGLLAHGMTIEETLEEYSGLTRDDVLACLRYAEKTMAMNVFHPFRAGV